jgi:hypothetical protein
LINQDSLLCFTSRPLPDLVTAKPQDRLSTLLGWQQQHSCPCRFLAPKSMWYPFSNTLKSNTLTVAASLSQTKIVASIDHQSLAALQFLPNSICAHL